MRKYESAWSIIEKFKLANIIDDKTFISYFGQRQYTRPIKRKGNCPLYLHQEFVDLFYKLTNVNLKESKTIIQKLTNLTGLTSSKDTFNDYLKYCPECMKKNYHSYLFQYCLVKVCPFHEIELIEKCPQCSQTKKWSLVNNNHYFCDCGYYMSGQINSPPWKFWSEADSQINLSYLSSWLIKMKHMTIDEVSRRRSEFFPERL